MLILGIETSCDETAAALVEDGKTIRSNIVASQMELHKKFGGVVPELASRAHIQTIPMVLEKAYRQARVSPDDVDAVAVTYGPGLIGSLLIGVCLAKSISYVHNLPLIGVNHLEGHLLSVFLNDNQPSFPFVALIASGGHTSLVYVKEVGDYRLLGATRDDAAGEAYDKVAKLLGLGYPGGPIIDKLARQGGHNKIKFPRPYLPGSFDFSFSGLKTAVLYYLKEKKLTNDEIADVAASFQAAVVDVLVKKSLLAVKETGVKTLVLGGGVTANRGLRETLKERASEIGVEVLIPPSELATDNAAMVAVAGYYCFQRGEVSEALTLNAVANLKL